MHKLAVFVEGYMELIFVQKLIEEIAGRDNVIFDKQSVKGGVNMPQRFTTLEAIKPITNEKFYVLIMNCGGETQVATRIKEQQASLTNAGYNKIIGMRDVRPTFSLTDIPRLQTTLQKQVNNNQAPVEFILSVMEIEAWFLAEYTHYKKIDPSITLEGVVTHLGFDPSSGDLSDRDNPTEDIKNVYALGGKTYYKCQTTIDNLDYAEVYINLSDRISGIKSLTNSIDSFLGLTVQS